MDRDPAVIFKISDLKEKIKSNCFITPENIQKMLSCRNCEGLYGNVTNSIIIDSEHYRLCSSCSQQVCIYCSPTNNFKKSNFVCGKRH